ncbi:hypothetical protein BOTBODRAFT_37212 [Botryobasidium botryosum FD-172 SS1]|uniref:Protein kinase domain-containing protein n=1 Tax=Botryobasidium botryosum (strain FD-172 SS1) TaxID=930990 RepID=A0A067MCJ9_BOTB1|nr:hypothetical protein BOTBODRAFT_37212 [Botryobasidium botryosum FD-172 SS1]
MDLDLSDIDLAGAVKKVQEAPVAQGGYSDIYLGLWTKSPRATKVLQLSLWTKSEKVQVAIKVVISRRSDQVTDRRVERRLNREISTWRRLDHPGIIKLYGISYDFGKFPALISPWYSNGDASAYLKAHPSANRHNLLRGVVTAVQYLHGLQPAIAHGDIKAVNVLVQDDGEACLGDFGLSRLIQHVSTGCTTSVFSGTPRWMAPELLFSEGDDLAPVTKEGDVYAIGCLALELTTDEYPWYSIRNNQEFMLKVHGGHLSPRPENEVAARELSDELWALITSCWGYKPSERPQVTTVHSRLLSIIQGEPPDRQLLNGQDIFFIPEITAAFARVQFNKEQCQLLCDCSKECFQAINDNWKPEDESTLAPAVDKFIELLAEIRTSIDTCASYSCFDNFIHQFDIANDVEAKLNRLEHIRAAFGLTAAMIQCRWSSEIIAVAREKDSSELRDVLKCQKEMRNLTRKNRPALDRVLGDLQSLLRRQMPGPEQEQTKYKIFTIQDILNVGLPETNLMNKIEFQKIGSESIIRTDLYEIWEGLWMGQQKVALKVVRGLHIDGMGYQRKRCQKLVMIWSKLCNEYILPLYGICTDDGPFPYLVLPWCSNGTANRYLRDKPVADRLKICLGAAYGLQYLHSLEQPVIHTAMRGGHILISNDGKPLLADFGMSDIIGDLLNHTYDPGVGLRWMAPETLGGGCTKGSDIWSWGMTTVELVSGRQPFASIKVSGTVLLKVAQGMRPNPGEYTDTVLKDDLWSLLWACWYKDAEKRPSINAVVAKMEAILEA